MKEYDLIVIGSGAGMNIASRAREEGLSVALVENGPLGGTCLNRGCIPSKIWIYPADVIRAMEAAESIGVKAKLVKVDFDLIQKRMWSLVLEDRHGMERGVEADDGLDLYPLTGEFIGTKRIKVGNETITAPTVVIACGARSAVPDIPGLKDAGHLLSETVFDIKAPPKSLVILGGGYEGCEFAHFFSSIGVDVKLLGHNPRLLPREEPDVSTRVLDAMSKKVEVHTNVDVTEVILRGRRRTVRFRDRSTGREMQVEGEEVLVCAGVRSNTDLLHPERSGVEMDDRGYIKVDEHLETSIPGIWALGDVIGRNMFRHTANYESDVVWVNMRKEKKLKVDEHAVPHAVFTHPQVASVGLKEADVGERGVLVGIADYASTAKGYAMDEGGSFVKVIVDHDTLEILGASICGPEAAVLIQPIVYLMNTDDRTYRPMARSQVIHPALSEVVSRAFGDLRHPHHH
jgi:mycothione reductase